MEYIHLQDSCVFSGFLEPSLIIAELEFHSFRIIYQAGTPFIRMHWSDYRLQSYENKKRMQKTE